MSMTGSSQVLVRDMLERYNLHMIKVFNNYNMLLTNKTFSQILHFKSPILRRYNYTNCLLTEARLQGLNLQQAQGFVSEFEAFQNQSVP